MYEICVQQMRDAILAAQRGTPPTRQGNADPRWFRQDVWPAAGDDRWIAISVRDAAQWRTLCDLAGGENIGAWTSTLDECVLMKRLQSAGIAAGVLQTIEDTCEHDAGLKARGALVTLGHPALGKFGHVRTPIDFSASKVDPFRAPAMGEHNSEIALEVAGLPLARVTELAALEVFK
jgi:crotonobetainyl-CoA:carnitine CoA-transferase CaiB-like acyl-CoA transferase